MSTRPIPARLAQLIRSDRYVEMRDLLWDNVAMRQQYEEFHGVSGLQVIPVTSRPRVREVTSIASWVSCFLTYLAVWTQDQATRNRITYALLVVREAMRHGGQGWMDYDRLFRQQAAIDPGLQWNVIHPQLQATTILSQGRTTQGSFCSLCQECDHSPSQCALAQLNQIQSRSTPSTSRSSSRSFVRICNSWNEGSCIYPGTCNYRHVCSNCHHPSHPAKDCRLPRRPRPITGPTRAQVPGPRPQSSS